MGEDNGQQPQDHPFRWVLTPHRSLTQAGFLTLMILFGGVSFVAGLVFLLMGAWPVLGFFGLDVLILYVAFRLNYRAGRAYETLEVDAGSTDLTRVNPAGRRQRFQFPTAWVRVNLSEGVDGRTELSLSHHRRAVVFARFLTDDERREFSSELKSALVTARGGPRI